MRITLTNLYKKTTVALLAMGLFSMSAMSTNVSADTNREPHQIVDINVTPQGANFSNFVSIGSTLYFITTDGVSPWGLWKSDGTEIGTVLVRAIDGTSGTPSDPFLTVMGSLLFL